MDPKHIVIDARIRRTSTGRYVDRLIEHLQSVDKDNVYTVLLQPDDSWAPTATNFATATSRYPQFSFNPIDQIGFAFQLKRLRPDLVHFTMTQQPIFYFGKSVTTTHDLTMLRFVRAGKTPTLIFWLKRLGYRFLFWWSHKKSARIIVPSNYVKGDLGKLLPFTTKITEATPEASEPPLGIEPVKPAKIEKPFIMYVGTAFPHKNLESLIKAFEIIKTSQPELKLVLAGKREYYYEQLEKLAADSPANDSIIFTGFVSDAELKWLYQNARAYVFPSLSEGFGLPGLEAMVHGCPVISSNATCLPEVYGNAAQYFDPNDIQDIANKTLEVISYESIRSELIKSGYDQVKKYSWRQMAQQTLKVYASALND